MKTSHRVLAIDRIVKDKCAKPSNSLLIFHELMTREFR